jgi:predicted O-methyltransferase YrrM
VLRHQGIFSAGWDDRRFMSTRKTSAKMTLLERRDTADGTIQILRDWLDGSTIYYQGIGIQSRGDAQGETLLGYGRMICCLAIAAAARSALVIGCAGGTIATSLHRRGIETVAIDTNPHAFALASRYFSLPPELETHVADGRTFLERSPRNWDVVILDAYNDTSIPTHLATAAFFRLASTRLSDTGLIIVNVVTQSARDRHADRIASAMNEAGLRVRLFDDTDDKGGNCLVVGGDTLLERRRLSRDDGALRQAASLFRSRPAVQCAATQDWFDGSPRLTGKR